MKRMTEKAIKATVAEVLSKLKLGEGSWRRSSWYPDYASLEFACFVSDAAVRIVREQFEALTKEHGWEVCTVWDTPRHRNAIGVTLQKSQFVSTSDARMPHE